MDWVMENEDDAREALIDAAEAYESSGYSAASHFLAHLGEVIFYSYAKDVPVPVTLPMWVLDAIAARRER